MSEVIESTVNAEPVENVEPQQEQAVTETESVNGDVATPQVEVKQVQTAEDNAKFAEVRRRAETEAKAKAKDELIAEMYGESHGIYTYEEYQKALAEQKRQEELDRLISDNIPEDIAKEIQEAREFRKKYETEQKTRAEKEAMEKNYQEFVEKYPDVKADEIPAEVWQEVNNGISLVKAYKTYALENEVNTLKGRLAEFEKGESTLESNRKNAKTSTGSVTGNGETKEQIITRDVFENNKHDRNWVIKNLSKITESRKKW